MEFDNQYLNYDEYKEKNDFCKDCCEDCTNCCHKGTMEALEMAFDYIDYLINHCVD